MMEEVLTSEPLVDNYITRQYIPEDKSERLAAARLDQYSQYKICPLRTCTLLWPLVYRVVFRMHLWYSGCFLIKYPISETVASNRPRRWESCSGRLTTRDSHRHPLGWRLCWSQGPYERSEEWEDTLSNRTRSSSTMASQIQKLNK
jgi:hypothetical protein